jgi:hypothetical protein
MHVAAQVRGAHSRRVLAAALGAGFRARLVNVDANALAPTNK